MTDGVNEQLFSAAKLQEVLHGDLDGDDRLHSHTGIVADSRDRSVMSFVESLDFELEDDPGRVFANSELGEVVMSKLATEQVTEALLQDRPGLLAFASGVTEEELTGDQLRLAATLLEALENNGAPAFLTVAGNPETGKTNTASLLIEMRSKVVDDLLVLSNVRSWEMTDVVVTSAHDLAVQLLEHRHRPKAVLIDEASTAMDARTYRREVAQQYTPLAKRYAKIGVDTEAVVVHSGKDLHPERKRLTTTAVYKTAKDVAEFYESWRADADFPDGRIVSGDVDALEPTASNYDPKDAAPWSWNLEAELFSRDLDWVDLLQELEASGPVE